MKKCLISMFLILLVTNTSTLQAANNNSDLKELKQENSLERAGSAKISSKSNDIMIDKKPVFTKTNSDEMMSFEKDIAFFYGAKEPQKIADHYIKAIQELENIGTHSNEKTLRTVMISPLQKAYEEVQKQTAYRFDTNKAALYEFQLILTQSKGDSFESIYQIMTQLYNEVFQSNSAAIQKAAMLRTFLYKYKISNLQRDNNLSNEDKAIMRAIAKESEYQLLQINK